MIKKNIFSSYQVDKASDQKGRIAQLKVLSMNPCIPQIGKVFMMN